MKHVRNCNSGLMGYRQLRRDPRHGLTRALQHESHRQQLLLTFQQHAPSAWRDGCPVVTLQHQRLYGQVGLGLEP